jgi:pimeloyl-ACP methyl ester carboxylesterase
MPMQSVNGVRLHYEEHGSGAPILCIHGAGSSAIAWADAARELARLGRVITYDAVAVPAASVRFHTSAPVLPSRPTTQQRSSMRWQRRRRW